MQSLFKNKVLLCCIIIFIFILTFIVRLWPIQLAHWWDETVYLQNAEVIYSGRENYSELNFRPPLLSIIFALSFFIKHHVFTASIVVALISTLACLFIFLIGKELYNVKTGIIASLIMAFNTFIVENSRAIMTDVPSLSFICISIYFLIIANKYKKIYQYFISGLFFSLAVLMKFTSLILIFVIPLYFIVKRINFKKIIYFIYGFGLGIMPYLIWAQITQGFFLKPFIIAQSAVSDKNENIFFYFINFIKAYHYIVIIGIIFWLIPTFIFIRFKTLKEKNIKIKFENHLNKVDLVFLIWIVLFLFYITITPHKELRYIIPIALPLIMLSSKGFVYFIKNENKIVRYFSIFLFILIFIVSSAPSFAKLSGPFINTYQTEEMKVSEFIFNNYPKNTLLYTNHNYPVFAYYTQMKTIKLVPQDASFYSVFPDNMHKKGILILYKGIKHPSEEWADNNTNFKLLKEFDNVILYNYTQSFLNT